MHNEYVEDLIKKFKLNFKTGNTVVSNKCTSYLLPMLGRKATDFKSAYFPTSQFRSLFIGDKTHDTFNEDKLLLLYKFSGREEFIKFEGFLENTDCYLGKYEPDKHHTMYVYEIPDKWLKDFNKFKEWKPSEFTNEYKAHIVQFYDLATSHPLYQTIHKKEERYLQLEKEYDIKIPRDLEASPAPYWEIEYYSKEFKVIDKIKEKSYGEWD